MENESIRIRSDQLFFISLFFLLCLFFDLSLFMFVNEAQGLNFRVFIYLLCLFCLILFHPIVSFLKGRFDLFETINICLFGFFLSFFTPAIIIFLNPDAGVMQKFWSWAYFEKGLVLVNLSLMALYIGYYFKIPGFLRNTKFYLSKEYNLKRAKLGVYILFAIYLFCLILFINLSGGIDSYIHNLLYFRGGMYYGYGILQVGLGIGFWFILFAYAYFFSESSFSQLIFKHKMAILVCFFLFLMLILTFSRGAIIGWFLMIMVYRHYLIKKMKVKSIIFFLGIFLIFATFLGTIRGTYDIDIFTTKPKGKIFLDNYLSTFGDMESFLVVLTNIPQVFEFFGGRSMLEDIFLPIIPRIIWSGKPEIYGPIQLWESIAGTFSSGSFYAVSIPGYFYMDFGILGIFFGFLIIGFSLKIIYQIFLNNCENRGVVLIYALFITLLQSITKGGFPTYLFLQYVLPVILVVKWVHGKSVRKSLAPKVGEI